MLAKDVVLHKDDFGLDHDVKGVDTVINYFKSYYDKHFSEHKLLAVGQAADQFLAFAFWVDEVSNRHPNSRVQA